MILMCRRSPTTIRLCPKRNRQTNLVLSCNVLVVVFTQSTTIVYYCRHYNKVSIRNQPKANKMQQMFQNSIRFFILFSVIFSTYSFLQTNKLALKSTTKVGHLCPHRILGTVSTAVNKSLYILLFSLHVCVVRSSLQTNSISEPLLLY